MFRLRGAAALGQQCASKAAAPARRQQLRVAQQQVARLSTSKVDHLGSYDTNFEDVLPAQGDKTKREFTYLALSGARFIYASAARLALIKFVSTMSASADVLALASVEVELGKIPEGASQVLKWRGKPVFVRHRTDAEIARAAAVDVSTLRDPETDSDRVMDPKWLVAVGVCTHLGCVPIANAGDYQGWFCPCHGSHYDVRFGAWFLLDASG